MKDTRVGTYALVGMVLVLAMKMRTLEHLLLEEAGPQIVTIPFTDGAWTVPLSAASVALLVAHTISRWTSLPLIYFCHYIQVNRTWTCTCNYSAPPLTSILPHN